MSYSATIRSQLIQGRLRKILDNMSLYSREILNKQGLTTVEAQEKALRQQLFTYVSEKNGTVVVLKRFPAKSIPEVIFSVSLADIHRARLSSSQPIAIANRTALGVEYAIMRAWRERQMPHLLNQTRRGLIVLIILISISCGLLWLQKRLAAQILTLSQKLSSSENLKIEPDWTSESPIVPGETGMSTRHYQYLLSLWQRHSVISFYRRLTNAYSTEQFPRSPPLPPDKP